MHEIRVLVTGVGGGGVGEQVVKALRLTGGYYLVGTDMTEYSMGLHQVDAKYIVPPASDGSYLTDLLAICALESIDVLVPGSEPELRTISENRQPFESLGILLLMNDPQVVTLCMNKWDTYLRLRELGFNVPDSRLMDERADTSVSLPAVIKPTLGGGGSFNCYIAQNQEELQFFSGYIRRQGMLPLAQQYLGTAEEEYTVGVLADIQQGEILGSIALRRQIMSGLSNRMRIPRYDGGPLLVVSSGISQGEFGAYLDVRAECERIAKAIGSRGPMNLQCRKHGGKVYVFEINPRLSGTTYMRALVGRNEPDILIRRHRTGKRAKLPDYNKGLVLRGLVERLIT